MKKRIIGIFIGLFILSVTPIIVNAGENEISGNVSGNGNKQVDVIPVNFHYAYENRDERFDKCSCQKRSKKHNGRLYCNMNVILKEKRNLQEAINFYLVMREGLKEYGLFYEEFKDQLLRLFLTSEENISLPSFFLVKKEKSAYFRDFLDNFNFQYTEESCNEGIKEILDYLDKNINSLEEEIQGFENKILEIEQNKLKAKNDETKKEPEQNEIYGNLFDFLSKVGDEEFDEEVFKGKLKYRKEDLLEMLRSRKIKIISYNNYNEIISLSKNLVVKQNYF